MVMKGNISILRKYTQKYLGVKDHNVYNLPQMVQKILYLMPTLTGTCILVFVLFSNRERINNEANEVNINNK